MRLDELLEELQAQVTAVRGTRDRVHQLLEAVLSVGRGLDLTTVLRHIVEAAVSLVDAEYGALGVIGEDGKQLSQFLTVGMSEERIREIGPFPTGHGILGELIKNPEPLRIPDIATHPASYGFPAHHPPMKTFLGVPIRVGDRVFGNLYLTDKHGGAEFDAEDESVLETLATAAGIAVDNARLFTEARLRERWLGAGAEVAAALLSGVERSAVLALIVDRAMEIMRADLAVVAFADAGQKELVVERAVGEQAAAHQDLVLPMEGSLAGAAMRAGQAVVSDDVQHDHRVTAGPPRFAGLGPAVAVPLDTRDQRVRGALLLARAIGQPPFLVEEIGPLSGFAGQAAVAMELAERRREGEQIALLEERDRIARDLHDLAIQRIFATGLTLQSALRLAERRELAERLQRAVDDLDETVTIIRTSIFGLRARERGPAAGGLRSRVVQVVERAIATLGFTPALRLEGLLDTAVPAELVEEVSAVLGEALSNVARHAQATAATVVVAAGHGELVVEVSDDGCGIPPGGRRSGLRNLAERAEQLGGGLDLDRGQDGGTRVTWRVPLREL